MTEMKQHHHLRNKTLGLHVVRSIFTWKWDAGCALDLAFFVLK